MGGSEVVNLQRAVSDAVQLMKTDIIRQIALASTKTEARLQGVETAMKAMAQRLDSLHGRMDGSSSGPSPWTASQKRGTIATGATAAGGGDDLIVTDILDI